MYPIFTPYGSFPPTATATNASTALDATAAPLTLSSIVQDHSLISDFPRVPDTDQLLTTQPRTLSSPEEIDCYVVAHMTEVVKERCMHHGGLDNTELVFQMTSWAINSITDDPFLREYYYWFTIYRLYTHDTQWDCLHHISSPAMDITTPLLAAASPSSQPSEAVSSPFTVSDVSNGSTPRKTCDYCQRTFSRKDAVTRHLKQTCTYTNERPFLHVFSVAE